MLKALKKYRAPYLLIIPLFILFLISQLIPTIWASYISLMDWKGTGTPDFCGFDNYEEMSIDDMFWESLGNAAVYWLVGLVFITCCALLITSLLNSRYLKSNSTRVFFKTVTFLPDICATITMGLIFRMLFDGNVDLVNKLATMFGGDKFPQLTSTTFLKIPVIILNVWRYTPWFTMILLLGLLNTPKDYYETAVVDGANGWQQFWFITLLSLKNILFFYSATLTVDMWKLLDESYVLPGPGTSGSSLLQYMYESGFSMFNMGCTSAIGVILILTLIVISITRFVVRHKQGEMQKSSQKMSIGKVKNV